MPWHYRFDPKSGAFLTEAFDVLSGEDLSRGIVEILGDPNFRPELRVFDDFTKVSRYDIQHPVQSKLHMQQESRRLRGRHALLLGATMPTGAGIDYFLDVTAQQSARFRIFFDRRAALLWINEGFNEAERIPTEPPPGSG